MHQIGHSNFPYKELIEDNIKEIRHQHTEIDITVAAGIGTKDKKKFIL